jgi:hypothetical protein
MEISFRRTIRLLDDGKVYDNPPDCGLFPLYTVRRYKDSLPGEIVKGEGFFLPIYGMLNLPDIVFWMLG